MQSASEIGVEAHRDQFDEAGALCILHLLQVMMSLDTGLERMVGVLHDVVEESP